MALAKRYAAASAAGLLPVIGIALLVAVLLSAGLSGFVTYRWNKGTAAIAETKRLKDAQKADKKTIQELSDAARALQQHGVDATLAYDQAAQRMDALASALEQNLEQDRQFATQQRDALAALAAARPDLRDMRLGDDILRHRNCSNQGFTAPGCTKPAARPAGQSAPAVPATPAGQQQRPAGAGSQPRRSDRPVSAVRAPGGFTAAGVPGMGAHGMDLVLRLGGADGAEAGGQLQPLMASRASAGARLIARDGRGES